MSLGINRRKFPVSVYRGDYNEKKRCEKRKKKRVILIDGITNAINSLPISVNSFKVIT
jgi:hypothetical protein